ncbi:MAG: hypothetical protein MJZ22_02190, partial [Candidatus Saccharibacteria bacterium]|nr:hypothetical protein [Candidatus Saccharibacteria bacterium]
MLEEIIFLQIPSSDLGYIFFLSVLFHFPFQFVIFFQLVKVLHVQVPRQFSGKMSARVVRLKVNSSSRFLQAHFFGDSLDRRASRLLYA